MAHLWVRAEQRLNEKRVGLTPEGARTLIEKKFKVTVEDSATRAFPINEYAEAGCEIAAQNSWPGAPLDAVIFGLKELPEDGSPLPHRHIMFGHAYKGQHSGQAFLRRFRVGGGKLYDLEYLVDAKGRRVAAFGYWAGYAGAAVTLKAWAAQQRGELCGQVGVSNGKQALISNLEADLNTLTVPVPSAIVIGALGRVGKGATDLLTAIGCSVTQWDITETAGGGPFPQILDHELFMNCIVARPGTPIFVEKVDLSAPRRLTAIGDVACDPDSNYNPIPIYDRATSWANPVHRITSNQVMDVMAIDNLPSLLPMESSKDYAAQLLDTLLRMDDMSANVWARAEAEFNTHSTTT
ncbi:saccharopine dehydrogenase [Pseudopelagicola sp. nBUS_20]|uniref:saccharopine dehydrogenase n=1 Tax=Pseudopelagicola sp. nBUS_20 TaxID=3395317 RepID=UPI003EB850FD